MDRRAAGQQGSMQGLQLASMQSRHKQDVIATLDLVGLLTLQLPVGIIDENQDTWTTLTGQFAFS